jgi:hypothetical protein
MVSKSYVVNEISETPENEEQSVNRAKMQNSDQMKKVDRYILHITEMVSDKSENKK